MHKNRELVFVVNNLQFFVSHRLPVAQAARASGWDVAVFAPTGRSDDHDRVHSIGVRHQVAWFCRKGWKPWQAIRYLCQGFGVALRHPDAIFHLITIIPILAWGIPLRLLKRRTIFALTGMGSFFSERPRWSYRLIRGPILLCFRWLFNHQQAKVIVQNNDDLNYLVNCAGVCPENIKLIRGSGVAPTEFPFEEQPPRSKTPTFLLPARLIRDKGIWDACEASQLLSEWEFKHEFWIAGSPDPGNPDTLTNSDLEMIRKKYPHVRLLGHRKDMDKLMRKVHAVCLPTIYREGVPKALIEAAAIGRPIVTYDTPGCRELVINRKTGYVLRQKDVIGLAQALREVIEQKDEADHLRRNAHQLFLKDFSVDRVIHQTLQLYQQFHAPNHGQMSLRLQ